MDFNKATDQRKFYMGIFLVLSKTFDTINHRTMIGKLQHDGICRVAKKWFLEIICTTENNFYNGVQSEEINTKQASHRDQN